MLGHVSIIEGADDATVADWLAERLAMRCAQAPGPVTVTVPGGATPFPIVEDLLARELPWNRLVVWPNDDRAVPEDHPASNTGKLRALFDTSDSDLGTAPDRKYALGYRYDAGPATGMIYDLELSRAEYAGDINATTLRGEAVKYYPPGPGGAYIIGQLRAAVTRPSGNADLGYDVAGVATIVTPGGLNIGAEIGFGKISYDLAPLAAMNNGYTAFKPFVSYRISDTAEVILRGEFVNSDLYELQGASIGIRLGL